MHAEHADFIIGKFAVKIEPEIVINGLKGSHDTFQMPKEDFGTPVEYFHNWAIKQQQQHPNASIDEIHSSNSALITEKATVKIKQEGTSNLVEDFTDVCQNSDEEFSTAAEYSSSHCIKLGCKELESSADESHFPVIPLLMAEKTKNTFLPKSVEAFDLEVRMEYDEVDSDVQKSNGNTRISADAAFNFNPCNLQSVKLELEELEVNHNSPTTDACNLDLRTPKSETSTIKQNGEYTSESCQANNSVNCSDDAIAENPDAIYVCIFCKQSFGTQSTLSLHLSSHYRERPYRCPHCKYAFKSKKNLTSHLPSHSGEPSHVVNVGDEAFSRGRSLRTNRVRHSNKKPHVCTVCGKGFQAKLDLRSHETSQCTEQPYACPLCKKAFKTKHSLVRHRLCHSNKRPFACIECGKSFKTRRNLKQHFESHSEERPHRCDSCGMEFKNKFVLESHVQRIHIKVRHFSCTMCDKSFVKRYELTRHMQLHTDKKSFLCSHCNKAFRTERNLMGHLSRATAKKSFQCENCDKAFKTKQDLASHAKYQSCTKGRSYSCNHCAKAFRRETHLNMHILQFSEKDHQTCHHCKRTFPTQQFKRHLLLILNRIPLFCKNCNMEFKTTQLFAQHLSVYQDVNFQTCNHCNKMFETKHELEQHLFYVTYKKSCNNNGYKIFLKGNLLGGPSNQPKLGSTETTSDMLSDNTRGKFQGRTYTRVPQNKRIEPSVDKNRLPETQERDLEGNLSCPSKQSTLGTFSTTGEMLSSAPRSTEMVVKTNTGQGSQNSIVRILKMSTDSNDTNRKFRGRTYNRVLRRPIKASADTNQPPETPFMAETVPSTFNSENTEILLEMAVEEG